MNWIINSYPSIVLIIGIGDTCFILVLGAVGATFWLFDIKAEKFFDRIVPATGLLIGTSIAAGIVMAITRYIVMNMAGA